jgi:hypothetical protein
MENLGIQWEIKEFAINSRASISTNPHKEMSKWVLVRLNKYCGQKHTQAENAI